MNNIINQFHFTEDIKKEFIVKSDGKVITSIRGASRIFKVSSSRLNDHLTDHLNPSQLAKMLIQSGFDLITLKEEGISDKALAVIAEYYAFDANQVSQETKQAAIIFIRVTSAIGVRKWIQHELGYVEEDRLAKMESKINAVLEVISNQQLALQASDEEKQQLKEEKEELEEVVQELNTYTHFTHLLTLVETNFEFTKYIRPITCREYHESIDNPLRDEKMRTLERRCASFYRMTKGYTPHRSNRGYVYSSKDIAFIQATIDLIAQGR